MFKWLKQNLRIKRFLGESRNAIRIQVYSAVIAYLLLRAYQRAAGTKERPGDILTVIRLNLFHRPPNPSEKPPPKYDAQMELLPC